MNQREIAIFLAFYFYLLNVIVANEIAPKPPLAQKYFGEIAVVGHHDFDSSSRNTALAYTHYADRNSYLCRSPQKREHLIHV